MAAARALVLHRRGAEDIGRQVQEVHAARAVRGGRPRRDEAGTGRALRSDGRAGSLCRARPNTGTLFGTAPLRLPAVARRGMEASPSPVYGAALLMRLGFTAPPGFKSPSLRPLTWEPLK